MHSIDSGWPETRPGVIGYAPDNSTNFAVTQCIMHGDGHASIGEMTTLAELVTSLGADLYPAEGGVVPDRAVSAVHVSELLDPAPYLQGGELLLTTGLTLTDQFDEAMEYVTRLKMKDVAALAFGLGVVHRDVPSSLVRACRDVGLPLLLIPQPTPFLSVTRRFWSLRAEADNRVLSTTLAAHHQLVRAASGRNPVTAVMRSLAGAMGGWAAQLDPDNDVVNVWPQARRPSARRIAEELYRHNSAGHLASASFHVDGEEVVVQPLKSAERASGHLAVGCAGPMSSTDRQLVLAASALLAVQADQRRRGLAAARAVRACVAQLVLSGHVQAARRLAHDNEVVLPQPCFRLLGVAGLTELTGDDVLDTIESRSGVDEPFLAIAEGRRLLLFVTHDHAHDVLPYLTRLIARRDPSVRALLSGDLSLSAAHQHLAGFSHALDELAPGDVRDAMADQPRHDDNLTPLLTYSRSDLVPAVVSYLRHRGHWERASAEIGVHRNTLRHRIATATKLLGQDLDDPDVASRTWLTLRAKGLA